MTSQPYQSFTNEEETSEPAHTSDNVNAETTEKAEKKDFRSIFTFGKIGVLLVPALSTSVSILLRMIYYQFFVMYLGASGNLHSISSGVFAVIQIFDVFVAILSDSVPFCGRRRKPYQIIAWCCYIAMCIVLILVPVPESRNIFSNSSNATCEMKFMQRLRDPNFRDFDTYFNWSTFYIVIFAICQIFMNAVGVTSNGLIVEWTRVAKPEDRGKHQTCVVLLMNIFNTINSCILGFGFNWYEYAGPWCNGIGIETIFWLLFAFGCFGLFATIFMTTEKRRNDLVSRKLEFFKIYWKSIQMTSLQKLIIFIFFSSGFQLVSSPADSMIVEYWVHMESLTGTITTILAELLSAIAMGVFFVFLVNGNWRAVLLGSQATFTIINFTLTNLAIFDCLRNQYLYSPDNIFKSVNLNLFIVLYMIFAAEYTEDNLEASFVTCLTWTLNAGSAFFGNLAVFIAAPFNVSSPQRYLSDTFSDRLAVASQSWLFNLLNLGGLILVIKLMPKNKAHCTYLKNTSRRSAKCAVLLFAGLLLITAANVGITIAMPSIQKSLG